MKHVVMFHSKDVLEEDVSVWRGNMSFVKEAPVKGIIDVLPAYC
jgi:hypothetical protein